MVCCSYYSFTAHTNCMLRSDSDSNVLAMCCHTNTCMCNLLLKLLCSFKLICYTCYLKILRGTTVICWCLKLLKHDSIFRCTDYVKFFLDQQRPEVNEEHTWNYDMCGNVSMIQKKHYSSTRSLILEFHTDAIQANNTGFRGQFRFIEKGRPFNL